MGAMAREEPVDDRGRQAGAKSRRRSRPGIGVAVITLAALAVVGVLAVQANGSQLIGAPTQQPVHSPAPPTKGATRSSTPSSAQPPANSGTGTRTVYSLSQHRVWLVDTAQQTTQSFIVVPGTIQPQVGPHTVFDRIEGENGSDGVSVEYVVLFAKGTSGSAIGFDADATITGLPAPPTHPTGGIRTTQADALAIWNFAQLNSIVYVVS